MGLINKKEEFNYFDCFCQVGEIAHSSSEYIYELMKNFKYYKTSEYMSQIHMYEKKADFLRHQLLNHLEHEFIAPIEREDISLLSQRLDDVVDTTEDVVRKLYMFNIKDILSEATEFALYILESSNELEKLLVELKNFKKSKHINDHIVEINTIENKGDSLHIIAIRKLFCQPLEPQYQIVWTNIFDTFENCLDTYEGVADLISSIVTKNT